MWRTIRKTGKRIFWILLILLVAVVAGGAYLWSRCDELLHDAIVQSIEKWAPDVKVGFGRCRLDWLGSVHVEQFDLTLPDESTPFIDLPDTIVDIDREALISRQEVVIESLKLVRPRLELSRHLDGTWSFQQLPPLPKSEKRSSLPELVLEQAEVLVHFEHPDKDNGVKLGTILLDDVDLTITPNGKRNVLVRGSVLIDQVGLLNLRGRLNVDSRTGQLSGRLTNVQVGRDLLNYVASVEPKAADQIAGIEQLLRDEMFKLPDPEQRSAFSFRGIARPRVRQNPMSTDLGIRKSPSQETSVDSADGAFAHRIPVEWIGAENSILGLMARLDLGFTLEKKRPDDKPRIHMIAELSEGELTNTALPFPLVDLESKVEIFNDRVVLHQFTGVNGPTRVKLSGTIFKGERIPTGKVKFRVERLMCDQRLRNRLSVKTGILYDKISPNGLYDIDLTISGRDGKWRAHDFVMSTKNGGSLYQDFPYPVTNARGTVRQEGRDLYVTMNGLCSGEPVSLNGFVKNPGENAWSKFEIGLQDIPIDDTLLKAAPQGFATTVEAMKLRGLLSGKFVFEKQPGWSTTIMRMSGRLNKGDMLYKDFPYYIGQLNGGISFDGRDWIFTDITGFHEQAKITTNGKFSNINGQQILDVTIETQNARIDKPLYNALSSDLKKIWDDYRPEGTIKKSVCKIDWFVGQPALIRFPEIQVVDGRSLAKSFPYQLSSINAQYEWKPGRLDIHSFSGKHNNTSITAKGSVVLGKNGDWTFNVGPFKVLDLSPNKEFLAALQPGIREVFSAIDPEHKIDLKGALQLRGVADERVPVTAGWHTAMDLTGGKVTMGMDFFDVAGRVFSKGSWDGYRVKAIGKLDLDRASVHDSLKLRMQDISGPFQVINNELIVGDPNIFDGTGTTAPSEPDQQVTAKFIGGVITTNVRVPLEGHPEDEFDLRVDLSHGDLERFAQLYLKSREKLQGVINGWVRITGTEESDLAGRGQLQISPAAIYRLPVVFQVLKSLQFTGDTDDSAFKYARADFRIGQEQFFFDAIDLVGPQLQLQGHGAANFSGRLNLTFVSMLPRSVVRRPQIWIPIVTEAAGLFSGVTDLVGVVVKVSGTFDAPETDVLPGKNLDKAFKRFINSLKPLPLNPPVIGSPRTPARFSRNNQPRPSR